MTRGTATNIFTGLHKAGVRRRDGQLVQARPAARGIELDLGAGRTPVFTNPWRADQTTAFRSTGIPNIDTYMFGAVQNAAGGRAEARLRGPEVNRFTALTAVEVARRVLAGSPPPPAGFATPAEGYGPQLVLVEGVELIDVR